MSENRINAYHVMWLFVFFDLPVTTKKERKDATQFRKSLEKDGFSMMQFSVYVIKNFYGKVEKPILETPLQLELF